MKYMTLFNVEIMHSFYADGCCADFQIESAPETQRLLNACRCVVKPLFHGLKVLVAVDETNLPFVALPKNPVFVFQLRLRNPDFDLFTDLDDFHQIGAPLFTNPAPATGGELALVSQQAWNSEELMVREDAKSTTAEAYCLGGRPLENLKPENFIVNDLRKNAVVRTYDADSHVITLSTYGADPGTTFTVDYPVAAQLPPGVFAGVEIKYDSTPAALSEGIPVFRIVFKPREAFWSYYIVTDSTDANGAPPIIMDNDHEVIFKPEDCINLNQSPDLADAVGLELAGQFPGKPCFRLISSNPVNCRESVRKNLQLTFGSEKIMGALPNPSLHQYRIDTGNPTRGNTPYLYQIVTLVTH